MLIQMANRYAEKEIILSSMEIPDISTNEHEHLTLCPVKNDSAKWFVGISKCFYKVPEK